MDLIVFVRFGRAWLIMLFVSHSSSQADDIVVDGV